MGCNSSQQTSASNGASRVSALTDTLNVSAPSNTFYVSAPTDTTHMSAPSDAVYPSVSSDPSPVSWPCDNTPALQRHREKECSACANNCVCQQSCRCSKGCAINTPDQGTSDCECSKVVGVTTTVDETGDVIDETPYLKISPSDFASTYKVSYDPAGLREFLQHVSHGHSTAGIVVGNDGVTMVYTVDEYVHALNLPF